MPTYFDIKLLVDVWVVFRSFWAFGNGHPFLKLFCRPEEHTQIKKIQNLKEIGDMEGKQKSIGNNRWFSPLFLLVDTVRKMKKILRKNYNPPAQTKNGCRRYPFHSLTHPEGQRYVVYRPSSSINRQTYSLYYIRYIISSCLCVLCLSLLYNLYSSRQKRYRLAVLAAVGHVLALLSDDGNR